MEPRLRGRDDSPSITLNTNRVPNKRGLKIELGRSTSWAGVNQDGLVEPKASNMGGGGSLLKGKD